MERARHYTSVLELNLKRKLSAAEPKSGSDEVDLRGKSQKRMALAAQPPLTKPSCFPHHRQMYAYLLGGPGTLLRDVVWHHNTVEYCASFPRFPHLNRVSHNV